MEPFNIQITHQQSIFSFLIMPMDEAYDVVYSDKVIARLRKMEADWELLPTSATDTPQTNQTQSISAFILDTPLINQITGEIENHLR